MAGTMLELRHIYKTFNLGTINEKKALIDVSLKLNDGDFVTVIGGNGAGKSTMLNAVAGVWPIDSGSIFIDGKDVTGLPDYQRASLIGRVFQDPMTGTAGTMQIDENLALAARRGHRRGLGWGVTREEREQYRERLRVLELGLEDRMTSKVGLLSGGQRQALTLLMATLQRPKILLLDEHTAALHGGARSEDSGEGAERDGAHRRGVASDDTDDHAQHAGCHRARQPADYDERGTYRPGCGRRGEETSHRGGSAS